MSNVEFLKLTTLQTIIDKKNNSSLTSRQYLKKNRCLVEMKAIVVHPKKGYIPVATNVEETSELVKSGFRYVTEEYLQKSQVAIFGPGVVGTRGFEPRTSRAPGANLRPC